MWYCFFVKLTQYLASM